ncbi:MAG: glutathione S-transferase family protein [Rhodospirillaceae bacterium]
MAKLVLYHAWASSASRKVRLCLHEKGLAFDANIVDLNKFEHHQDWYKKLNPSGIVPALMVDGKPLVESNFINEYMDETYPEPALRPENPMLLHDMRLWAKYIDDTCLPAIQKHNWMHHFHPMAREWSDAELERRLAAIPTENRRHVWYRMARDPYTAEELETALNILRDMMDRIEARVAATGFVNGNTYSLADIAAAPYVIRLEELSPDDVSDKKRPASAQWWQALKARPAYAAAHMEPFNDQCQTGWEPC